MDPEVWIIYLDRITANIFISCTPADFNYIVNFSSFCYCRIPKELTAIEGGAALLGRKLSRSLYLSLILFPNLFEPKPALLSSATSSFLHRCSPKPFSLPLCLCPSVGLVKPSFWLFEEIRSVFLPSLPVWKINKILP